MNYLGEMHLVRDYVSLVRHPDNASLFQAVEMSILAAQSKVPLHIHAEGLRGTGKTSILRAARSIVPRIERVRGCLYNCDPKAPHCPKHAGLDEAALAQLGSEWIPMPFLEISHSAKVATIVGGIDLEKLVSRAHPEAALLPGTLAQAHRGIVFIDEINRLADTSPELADILLDVMGTKPGRLQIEDPGLPKVEISSLVTVWAASNPDEDPGPLEGIRRQLADRFDLCVGVKRPTSHATLMAILQPEALDEVETGKVQQSIAARFMGGLQRMAKQSLNSELLAFLANVYLDHGLESLRALEAITLAAKVHAALGGKNEVDREDLRAVIPLALKHRVAPHVLGDIMEVLNNSRSAPEDVPEAKEVASQESILDAGGNNRGFLSRLFGSLREPGAEDKEATPQTVLPVSTPAPMPLGDEETRRALIDANLVNPELVTIIAPPNAALPLDAVSESRLVMGEVELGRDK